jgi:hypothetical protein
LPPQERLADGERALRKLLGVGVPTLVVIEPTKVVQAIGYLDVIGTEQECHKPL